MATKNPILTTLICLPLLAGLFACSGKSDPQEPMVASSIGGLGQEDSHVGEELRESRTEVLRLTSEIVTLTKNLEEQNQVIAQKSKLIRKLQDNLDSFNKMIGYGIDVPPPPTRSIPFPLVNGSIEKIAGAGELVKINRGQNRAVRLGHIFEVVRDEKQIGLLIVTSTSAKSCVCELYGNGRNQVPLRVGDEVRTWRRENSTERKAR